VLDGTKLVGIVSERDLYLIETLRDVNPEDVRVEEAMTVRTYCVSPETSLEEVAGQMAEHKYGCALVLEGDAVVGMFTTVDALRVLVHLLHRVPHPPSPE
jgi:acetoin utilization protein AcuB